MPRQLLPLGHLLGVPVFAEFSSIFIVLFVFFFVGGGIQDKLLALVGLIITIIGHELGHALAARARGARGVFIVLGMLGGYCAGIGGIGGWKRVMIVLAGPAANAVMAVLAWVVYSQVPEFIVIAEASFAALCLGMVWWIFMWNVVLGIFNILPIYPLDGGQATLGVMTQLADERRARALTLALTVIGGLALIALWMGVLGGEPNLFMILLMASLVFQAWNDLR